jgi:hypothetical protein
MAAPAGCTAVSFYDYDVLFSFSVLYRYGARLCASAYLARRGSIITPGSALVFDLELLRVLD